MILSDGEIQEALRERKILIDPMPTEEQYTTSAVDLLLGDEVLELKTLEELQAKEPLGVQRPLIVDLSNIDVKTLLKNTQSLYLRKRMVHSSYRPISSSSE